MACDSCPVRGDPCARLKAILKRELDVKTLEVCPMFLANVIAKPERKPVTIS